MDEMPDECRESSSVSAPSRPAKMIRTFVAEPTTLTRLGLVARLSREKDIELIAAVKRAEEIMPAARELRPDVALLAAVFPDHDGILIARSLHDALPGCRCAILSHARHPGHLERAIAARVHGYLVCDCPAEAAFARRPGTLVVVAHRISSALRARRILVLDGNQAQIGVHASLLADSAMYRDLVGYWNQGRADSRDVTHAAKACSAARPARLR